MTTRFPTFFVSHGGGPWPWVDGMREQFALTEREFRRLPELLPATPKAILVITGHWEAEEFTVSTSAQPPMEYDYSGFPPHTYSIQYKAPGSQALAARVRELLAQVPGIDAVIAPIGGGGMVSGTCLTLSTIAPGIRIYAGEPEMADDAARSFRAGHIIADDAPETVADGLKVPLKELTWHFVKAHVTDILTVSEADIVEAMKLVWARMKIIIEPSCAVPVAAVLKNPSVFKGLKVGIIITGGNVDLDKLPWM